jgi:hypothetical protein
MCRLVDGNLSLEKLLQKYLRLFYPENAVTGSCGTLIAIYKKIKP